MTDSNAPAAPLLPERVREAAQWVAQRSVHVRIDHDALRAFVATLDPHVVAHPALEPGDLPQVDEEAIVAWVLTVNAINFGSGFFPVLRKRPGLSGSRTVFAALRDRFDAEGPFTVAELSEMTASRCAATFNQDPEGPAAELMGWFAAAWRELGDAVHAAGGFASLVARGEGSAAALATHLSALATWTDEPLLAGRPIPLAKRAQIVPAHLAMAFGGAGHGAFHDLDRLTIFADNLVPHVLRIDGVLTFDGDLQRRIDAEELLVPGSAEEVEIRAVAVHACELLVRELRDGGVAATAMGLDQVLWNRGAGPRYKAHPRHRVRTTAY